MTTLYLDTSALVKLYVEEEGRGSVFEAVERAQRLATSTVAYAEARAAFARKRTIGDLDDEGHRQAVSDLDDEWRSFVRIPVSNLLAHRAGEMAERYALRGFDAIHLASAARLQERVSDLRFMAFDDRLVEAARGASVPVYEEP
ncbi:MAG: type II toxin-antitoxin system VapC family toxin [Rubrobacter sp.]